MPSSCRRSSSPRNNATESAPAETATARQSPGRTSRCLRMYLRTFSITTIRIDLFLAFFKTPKQKQGIPLAKTVYRQKVNETRIRSTEFQQPSMATSDFGEVLVT